jgi:predicted RNA-binding Zn ribbon-like protein
LSRVPTKSSPPRVVELQPAGRAPAPGQLALVQAFANSFWDLERGRPEQFGSPRALAEWLQKRGLLRDDVRLSEADLWRAHAVRTGVRALLSANAGATVDDSAVNGLNCALEGVCLRLRVRAGALPELAPASRDFNGALAAIAGAMALAQFEGGFERLKACPGPDCGWAFYDASRNLAGTWCSMSICGSRVKAREYRRRRRGS